MRLSDKDGPAAVSAAPDPDHEEVLVIDRSVREGDPFVAVGMRALEGREQRALKLFRERGDEIQQVGADIYFCPSQDGTREHLVRYGGAVEECDCGDYVYRGGPCVHLYATAIRHAKKRRQRRDNFLASLCGGLGPASEAEDRDA
jgi:hypothetical protein